MNTLFNSGNKKKQDRDFIKTVMSLAKNPILKAVVFAVSEVTKGITNRPNVKSSLGVMKAKLFNTFEEKYKTVEQAEYHAQKIAAVIKKRGKHISRIGISGIPGSGKSTLARALAKRLGLTWVSLDHEAMNTPKDFSGRLTIYEHHRLFQTQDMDAFDAIIYIDETVQNAQKNVLERTKSGRGALILDVLNFEKLKGVSKLAFDICDGDKEYISGIKVVMKFRTVGGFNAMENIVHRLTAFDFDVTSKKMEKEEMLFLLEYGKRQSGLSAYLKYGAYNEEIIRGLMIGISKYLEG
ncbi:MAG: AAA family ATPase [Bacteriovoracaceae bacterium]|nr:AAA family ATPase [Bacteriovoracaceae bacterium]